MESFVSSILLIFLGAVITLITQHLYKFCVNWNYVRKNFEEQNIQLKFISIKEDEKELLDLKYGIRTIKHYSDEIDSSPKHIINEDKYLSDNSNEQVTIKQASILVHKIGGTQFKFFVDYNFDNELGKLTKFLENNGYVNIDLDGNKLKHRLWFTTKDYNITTSADFNKKNVNNIWRP